MNIFDKISILGPSAQYDTCGPKDFGQTSDVPGVYEAKVAGGHTCKLFKVLQTNVCKNNCKYCAWRQDRDTPRVSTTPDEMASAFASAWRRKLVHGLFLSSGIAGSAESTMDKLIDTATVLRQKIGYSGYIHLKLMPGASAASIRESLRLANRVSLNIEAPTEADLQALSPDKDLKKDFFYTLSLIKAEVNKLKFGGKRPPSLTTQFVVGAGEENDRKIVSSAQFLYKNFGLYRAFYSAFRPVPDTPLAGKPAASLTREHRLYQADFLLRQYRFTPYDIPFDTAGFLPETTDPKTLWASQHPEYYPVNLNTADYWTLLKIPGLGPTSAKKIVSLRRQSRIRRFSDLENQRFQIRKIREYSCL